MERSDDRHVLLLIAPFHRNNSSIDDHASFIIFDSHQFSTPWNQIRHHPHRISHHIHSQPQAPNGRNLMIMFQLQATSSPAMASRWCRTTNPPWPSAMMLLFWLTEEGLHKRPMEILAILKGKVVSKDRNNDSLHGFGQDPPLLDQLRPLSTFELQERCHFMKERIERD